MPHRSLRLHPRSAASPSTKSQTLPRTCRATLASGPRITRSKMLALSMGLMGKLGLKGKPAVAASGNDLSAPSASDAADQALQGRELDYITAEFHHKYLYLTLSNTSKPISCSLYQCFSSPGFLLHLCH